MKCGVLAQFASFSSRAPERRTNSAEAAAAVAAAGAPTNNGRPAFAQQCAKSSVAPPTWLGVTQRASKFAAALAKLKTFERRKAALS